MSYLFLAQNQCLKCPQEYKPNKTGNGCESLPIDYINNGWVIALTTISGTGIILAFGVTGLFLYYNNTAVVKASGRDLSYPLLAGIILCYIQPYILLANPTPITCGLSRFGLGFSSCICYTALVIKTNRIERVFKSHNASGTDRPRNVKSITQLLILLVVILIEALLAITGLFVETVTFKDEYFSYKILRLCRIPRYDFVVAYCCNIILILACTVCAYRTRKVPACFNEAKCIGFVMYTTCIIWIAFIPVYFGMSLDYRRIAICMNMNLSATSILAGVFGPKIYIVIFRPARNIRSRSGLSIRHVYSNQSFEEDASGM